MEFSIFYLRIFELLGILTYSMCVLHSLRNKKPKSTLLFFATVTIYAWFLEEMGVIFWESYFYNPQFLVFVDKTPLAVTFGWASIIYAVISVAPSLVQDQSIRALLVSIYALFIDLGMDVTAYWFKIDGFGFWEWTKGSHYSLYGVPAFNYLGWFLVVFWFTRFYFWLSNNNWSFRRRMLFGPILSIPVYGISLSMLILGLLIAFLFGVRF